MTAETESKRPTVGSMFTGYGGLDMGLDMAIGPLDLSWVADPQPGPKKVLGVNWPHVPNLGDVTTVDWAQVAPVDIITGGSPCQDISIAGRRAGMGEGTRSGLWSKMRDAVNTIRPKLVIWENVRGATSSVTSRLEPCAGCVGDKTSEPAMRTLGSVLADLADIGYDAQWLCLRASDVGAPHRRDRVFLVAHPRGDRRKWGSSATDEAAEGSAYGEAPGCDLLPADHLRFGEYAKAIQNWADVMERRPPEPTEFVEWMMGLPEGWVTSVKLSWTEQLRLLGNGVVPQQAAAAIRELIKISSQSEPIEWWVGVTSQTANY